MLHILSNTRFATLYAAQVAALLGTGLLTIGLALLAYDLAGAAAGAVLGTALAIKMVAYVGVAPLAQAVVASVPRKAVLILADLVRAAVALSLPFVDAIWQIYGLIFVLQAASATFTPTFQATIPDILPDEEDYTRALSLSRLAYETENVLSPVLAGILLSFIAFNWLFLGTVIGFLVSAILVSRTELPALTAVTERPFRDRLSLGLRIYFATPRLRGLMALNLAVAAAGAFVIVNTVVLMAGDGGAVARAMTAFGAGSVIAALALPQILKRGPDRRVMMTAAWGLVGVTAGLVVVLGLGHATTSVIWAIWAATGAMATTIMTASGRLLARSTHKDTRPAVFTAQFAASHACWLVTYPLAGWSGAGLGLPASAAILLLLAIAGTLMASRVWPPNTRDPVLHSHDDLPQDHPHLAKYDQAHAHPIIIDDVHPRWPT